MMIQEIENGLNPRVTMEFDHRGRKKSSEGLLIVTDV